MYIPRNLRMENKNDIGDFIAEFGFATLVSKSLEATHLPFIFQPNEGTNGRLIGHMAKANAHWKTLEGESVLAIFNGPHSYISPTWYASGPAVPTWNYAAIHCYGRLHLLGEEATMHAMDTLVKKYEPDLLSNLALMPESYKVKLAKAVVGFQIDITDIQAKEKLGQQRKEEDQRGVTEALAASSRLEDQMLLGYMKSRSLGTGG